MGEVVVKTKEKAKEKAEIKVTGEATAMVYHEGRTRLVPLGDLAGHSKQGDSLGTCS